MNDIELSYQELQGLEEHFRKIQSDAVVEALRKTPCIPSRLLHKLVAKLKPVDQLRTTEADVAG